MRNLPQSAGQAEHERLNFLDLANYLAVSDAHGVKIYYRWEGSRRRCTLVYLGKVYKGACVRDVIDMAAFDYQFGRFPPRERAHMRAVHHVPQNLVEPLSTELRIEVAA